MSEEYMIHLFRESLECLKELRQAGYAHKDIKADNFLFKDGYLGLIDFAFCKPLNQKTEDKRGTIDYVPPECISKKFNEIDPSA